MKTYRYNGANVSGEFVSRTGMLETSYGGVLTSAAFDVLRGDVLRETARASAVVIRMDKSLIAMADMPDVPRGTYHVRAVTGAVIVRADQYAMWSAYARRLAQIGVMRAVFLDSQGALPYEWALRQVAAQEERLRLPRVPRES